MRTRQIRHRRYQLDSVSIVCPKMSLTYETADSKKRQKRKKISLSHSLTRSSTRTRNALGLPLCCVGSPASTSKLRSGCLEALGGGLDLRDPALELARHGIRLMAS